MIIQRIHNSCIGVMYFSAVKFANHYLFPLIVLFMRLWIARIFWYSGLNKISSWQSTIYLVSERKGRFLKKL